MTDIRDAQSVWVSTSKNADYVTAVPVEGSVEFIRADLDVPAVKELEWVDHPFNGEPVVSMAVTPLGTYFICDDMDDFTGLYLEFVGHKDATWWGSVKPDRVLISDNNHIDDYSPIQDAAQADFDRRVRECLK